MKSFGKQVPDPDLEAGADLEANRSVDLAKARLLDMTPASYVGKAVELAKRIA